MSGRVVHGYIPSVCRACDNSLMYSSIIHGCLLFSNPYPHPTLLYMDRTFVAKSSVKMADVHELFCFSFALFASVV